MLTEIAYRNLDSIIIQSDSLYVASFGAHGLEHVADQWAFEDRHAIGPRSHCRDRFHGKGSSISRSNSAAPSLLVFEMFPIILSMVLPLGLLSAPPNAVLIDIAELNVATAAPAASMKPRQEIAVRTLLVFARTRSFTELLFVMR